MTLSLSARVVESDATPAAHRWPRSNKVVRGVIRLSPCYQSKVVLNEMIEQRHLLY
jgi:hypothetical protein